MGRLATFKNGKELKSYDDFYYFIEKIKKEFIKVKDYKGFPMLPECWLEGHEIYDNAPDEEKRLIFISTYTLLLEVLRKWKVDRDSLYGKDGWHDFYI